MSRITAAMALVFASSTMPALATGVPYYILQGVDQTQNDEVIGDDRISGFTIRVSWRKLHEEGFAWLDQQMARGAELDRDIQLRVMGGVHSPQNLPDVDYFLYNQTPTGAYRAPVPWDANLVPYWQSMVGQLESRYANHPRLRVVHLPGFADSSEMHTPDELLSVPGYSSQALAEAWVNMSGPLITAFASTDISLNYATPTQANLSGADSDWVLDQIIAQAGNRAGFQANDLSAKIELDRNKYETLVDLKQEGYSVGFQMLSISTADRFGGEFQEAVGTGLEAGAEWLEIYSPDLPLIPLAGDYNYDGQVNIADYSVWRDALGSSTDLRADGSGNSMVDATDYQVWKDNFGQTAQASLDAAEMQVPEPPGAAIIIAMLAMGILSNRRWLERT